MCPYPGTLRLLAVLGLVLGLVAGPHALANGSSAYDGQAAYTEALPPNVNTAFSKKKPAPNQSGLERSGATGGGGQHS